MAAARLLLLAAALALLACGGPRAGAQLSAGFYSAACPAVHGVVRQAMSQAVMNDSRSGAAVLRLFFHDCFVNVSAQFHCSPAGAALRSARLGAHQLLPI